MLRVLSTFSRLYVRAKTTPTLFVTRSYASTSQTYSFKESSPDDAKPVRSSHEHVFGKVEKITQELRTTVEPYSLRFRSDLNLAAKQMAEDIPKQPQKIWCLVTGEDVERRMKDVCLSVVRFHGSGMYLNRGCFAQKGEDLYKLPIELCRDFEKFFNNGNRNGKFDHSLTLFRQSLQISAEEAKKKPLLVIRDPRPGETLKYKRFLSLFHDLWKEGLCHLLVHVNGIDSMLALQNTEISEGLQISDMYTDRVQSVSDYKELLPARLSSSAHAELLWTELDGHLPLYSDVSDRYKSSEEIISQHKRSTRRGIIEWLDSNISTSHRLQVVERMLGPYAEADTSEPLTPIPRSSSPCPNLIPDSEWTAVGDDLVRAGILRIEWSTDTYLFVNKVVRSQFPFEFLKVSLE